MTFLQFIKEKPLLLDGAMGTRLQEYEEAKNQKPEALNLSHPNIISEIHQSYLDAGADALITNTFGANSIKLSNESFTVKETIEAAISIAKSVKAPETFIGLNIGPTGKLLKPMGDLSFEEAYQCFLEQIQIGVNNQVDFLYFQTFSDLQELRCGILCAKEHSTLPIVASITLGDDLRTLTGTDPLSFAVTLRDMDVQVLGINCSFGPDKLLSAAKVLVDNCKQPVLLQPNAGLPIFDGTKNTYSLSPASFLSSIKEAYHFGVRIFGGCCGTTKEHIQILRTFLDQQIAKPFEPKTNFSTQICSYSKTVSFDHGVVIIGERLNPTGKKKIKAALLEKHLDVLLEEAIMQTDLGAEVLDVNVGTPGIDHKEMMGTLITELQSVLDTPLQIDAESPEVIEQGLRNYCGKALINSVNGKDKSLQEILPLAKKYGSAILGLTLDENGLPEDTASRIAIGEKIVNSALQYGIPIENIFLDTLTLTVSAQQEQVGYTLEALKQAKSKLGVKTILGASNVSFGLPERTILNRTFLAMALQNGLDAPITDPLNRDLLETILSFRVLSGQDKDAKNYITYMDQWKKEASSPSVPSKKETSLEEIIWHGRQEAIIASIEETLHQKTSIEIIDEIIIPCLEKIGAAYAKNEIYLPQLIRSAETVKKGFVRLKEEISSDHSLSKGKILLATVEGDVHDIGKNIVKVLLENHGFEVLDLGKDVSAEKVLLCAKEENISLIGLSSLMTTTLPGMERTISLLKEHLPNIQVMVGGAVLTASYAKKIGADFYGKDAQESVDFAKEFFGKEKIS